MFPGQMANGEPLTGSWLTLSLALAEARLALDTDDDTRANALLPSAIAESRAQRNLYYESLALVLWCRASLRNGDAAGEICGIFPQEKI